MDEIKIYFIVTSAISLIILSLLLLYPLYQRYNYRHNFEKKYYQGIYRYVLNKDYLLINNFVYTSSGYSEPLVNHMVFGKKYIYLIFDFYFYGGLEGEENDKLWIYYPYKKNPMYVTNPLLTAKDMLDIISSIVNADKESFIPIVLLNNTCIYDIKRNSGGIVLTNEKNLKKTFHEYESQNIKDLNQTKLFEAVKNIASINERK